MSDKSIWQGLTNVFGGRKSSGSGPKGLTTMEQRCPVCQNALDPKWSKCPYCEAAKNAGNRSSPVPQPQEFAAAASRRSTRIEDSAPEPAAAPSRRGGGHTMVDSSPMEGTGAARHPGGGRRITGILTTFTWSRAGQLFQVRDGRNYAGSGSVSSDNNSPCEIQIPNDQNMSSAHFLILCQGGKYIISDNFSTNGTYVNGAQIDTRGVDLTDNATIKAGATVFTFQKIQAAAGASTIPPCHGGGQSESRGEDTVF